MRPRLPPLNTLKAFEAAARSESFTRAAEELCVTQGAVSHQIKALEVTLGLRLFTREHERLVQRQSSGVLTVSTSPDFAAKWLVCRLGRFAESHPELDLRISATPQQV